MMKRGLRASVLLCWLFLPILVADELSPLTSSLFEMKLVPTKMALQSSAANKLQLSVKMSLFQSVSITSGFDHVFDIDIVLQKMQWTPEDESTTVQFQAHVTFYTDNSVGSKNSQPSRFSLDSLVARTFSQPSTKSGFIVQLGLSKDPSLAAIEEVLIQLVPSSEAQVTSSTQDTRQFSTLDAVLITASSAIFLGILCLVYVQHRARERYEEDFLDMDRRQTRAEALSAIGLEQEASPDTIDKETTSKVDVTASMDSADDMTQEPALYTGRDSDNHFQGVNKNEALQGTEGRAVVDSPPLSPSRSVPSSSSEASPQTRCSSVPSSPVSSARTTAYLLGVSTPTAYPGDNFPFSTDLSPLTARLLRLPAMRPGHGLQDKRSSRSYVSAPGKLIAVKHLSPTSSASSRDGARSVRSVRSARSASGLFDVIEHPRLEASSTRSSGNVTDLAVISEQNILIAAASKEFENNWKISEKRAEDDDEDGSVLDVFHVDVDQHNSLEDNQSRMSGLSAVSEWMKSIRVVGGGSVDSRTSAMSKSSAEHSSVEPKSMQGRDSGSVDYSLERSLATSIVEV
jgi:hypothetical protein